MQQALAAYRHPLASEHRIDLRGRVGLNTGPVIVDRMKIVSRGGEHLASDPMAELAASLLDRAAPGQILVGAETATAAGYAFTLRLFGEGIWALERLS
jgi:class 3 adenylate cyclase